MAKDLSTMSSAGKPVPRSESQALQLLRLLVVWLQAFAAALLTLLHPLRVALRNRDLRRRLRKNPPHPKVVKDAAYSSKRYREGYPGTVDDPTLDLNLQFYHNELPLPPPERPTILDFEDDPQQVPTPTIDEIHRDWLHDFRRLEYEHHYIQWLFPIREHSRHNPKAQPLQLHEAKSIRENPQCSARVIRSYKLFLDFLGMLLQDPITGALSRSDRFRSQYDNLERNPHNNLRITRMLKSLGDLGLEHFKKPFVLHILTEIYEHNELTFLQQNCVLWWAPLLRNPCEAEEVHRYLGKYA